MIPLHRPSVDRNTPTLVHFAYIYIYDIGRYLDERCASSRPSFSIQKHTSYCEQVPYEEYFSGTSVHIIHGIVELHVVGCGRVIPVGLGGCRGVVSVGQQSDWRQEAKSHNLGCHCPNAEWCQEASVVSRGRQKYFNLWHVPSGYHQDTYTN